jgi:cytochrome c oxidase cbb3-type subunit 3/ubiquinol-cytochrome c reductase cytochrome c subunit
MPDWREDIPGQPLTPQQISDVVAWLTSQRQPVVGRSGSSIEVRRSQP